MEESRPANYPKLENYTPTRFMFPTSHYDERKADRAVRFIENLRHTKSKWAGQRFWLLPWQEQIIRDIFGVIKEDGLRQFRTAFVEICKKMGKSELAAAVALCMLYADGEASPEVYGAASDRQQASIVFDVAKRMVEQSPALLKRSKIMAAQKRLVSYGNAGFYQVLSAEIGNKHGLNISCAIIDECHSLPNRKLYEVLTQGASDAREQPLTFTITTAGNDKQSICYELHTKAKDLLEGRKTGPTFYPVAYGLEEDDDWGDEENWKKACPSLGYTVPLDRMRDACRNAIDNPAEENAFKQLGLNIWTSAAVRWIPEYVYERGNKPVDMNALIGRDCYAGLDLSTTTDITALVLIFPPRAADEDYVLLPFFWLPEDTIPLRAHRDHVNYDVWQRQGYFDVTPGNVVDYNYIRKMINDLNEQYHICEIAADRWNASQLLIDLDYDGFTVVPIGHGMASMSAPTKEFYKLLMEGKINHGGNPVLAWMAGSVVVETDAAENVKPAKNKSTERIDGIVAAIMALDRCIRHENTGSIYDNRDMVIL